MSDASIRSKLLRWSLQAAFMGVLTLALIEGVVRIWHPQPRTQVIRPSDRIRVYEDGGVPMHEDVRAAPQREDAACEGADHTVVFVGDSVLSTPGSEAFSKPLRGLLNDGQTGRWCIHNVAIPGFDGVQKLASAKRAIAAYDPDLLVYGIWTEGGAPWMLDGVIYKLPFYPRDAEGFPYVRSWGVPHPVNRLLFRWSEAWRYAVLALAPPSEQPDLVGGAHEPLLIELMAVAHEAGVAVWGVEMPLLTKPFADSVAEPYRQVEVASDVLEAHGATTWSMAAELVDEDVTAIRLDLCCHYTVEGNVRLADIFARRLRNALTPKEDGTSW